jgi:hypothetical protein
MSSGKGGILGADIRNESMNNFFKFLFKHIFDLFNLRNFILLVLTSFCYVGGADIDTFLLLHFFTDLLELMLATSNVKILLSLDFI